MSYIGFNLQVASIASDGEDEYPEQRVVSTRDIHPLKQHIPEPVIDASIFAQRPKASVGWIDNTDTSGTVRETSAFVPVSRRARTYTDLTPEIENVPTVPTKGYGSRIDWLLSQRIDPDTVGPGPDTVIIGLVKTRKPASNPWKMLKSFITGDYYHAELIFCESGQIVCNAAAEFRGVTMRLRPYESKDWEFYELDVTQTQRDVMWEFSCRMRRNECKFNALCYYINLTGMFPFPVHGKWKTFFCAEFVIAASYAAGIIGPREVAHARARHIQIDPSLCNAVDLKKIMDNLLKCKCIDISSFTEARATLQ